MRLPMRIVVSGLLALSSASPIAEVRSISDISRRDVTLTAAQFSNFQFFSQYAAASYCVNNNNSTGDALVCAESACPLVEASKAYTVLEFDEDQLTGEVGYLAVDPTNKLLVLSFRGSSSLRNWVTDFVFLQTAYSVCSGCYVHNGFLTAWTLNQAAIVTALTAAVAEFPTYAIVVVGHSLGAAVATLAGAWMRENGFPCDIYTYGSPRVGNTAFANFVTAQAGGTYRITHLDDAVPRLPPILLGFHHTSPEYWLYTGNATTVDYTISDMKICEGISNTTCNAGQSTLDFSAHSYYFEHTSACEPDFSLKVRARDEGVMVGRRDEVVSSDILGANEEKYAAFMMLDIAYGAALVTSGVGESGWLA